MLRSGWCFIKKIKTFSYKNVFLLSALNLMQSVLQREQTLSEVFRFTRIQYTTLKEMAHFLSSRWASRCWCFVKTKRLKLQYISDYSTNTIIAFHIFQFQSGSFSRCFSFSRISKPSVFVRKHTRKEAAKCSENVGPTYENTRNYAGRNWNLNQQHTRVRTCAHYSQYLVSTTRSRNFLSF